MKSILRSGRIACAILAIASSTLAFSATSGSRSARSLVTQKIDNTKLVTLAHNVRPELTAKTDLGPVEDSMPIARMFMVLNRTPEQQAAMANLIERQHQASAPEFHQWLTPDQVGERFGASEADIAKVTDWLTSQGFKVNYVTHNNSIIDFSGTARTVREAFHTQMHYVDVNGEKRVANAQDPQIPAALAPLVAGIVNLHNVPPHAYHTTPHHIARNESSAGWQDMGAVDGSVSARPGFLDGDGNYAVGPQDFYTIYNENPILNGGHTGSTATIAVIEETAIVYGTVNGSTHQATGGDVATFRSLFGVPGTLNMDVYYGDGSTTCTAPGIVSGEETEATLDAEWATATAPNAKLIFMTCANNNELTGGIFASMTALVDNNLSDSMSLSYGFSEEEASAGEVSFFSTTASTAATQGQSIFISSGDSGSDVADQNTTTAATSGINVSAFSAGPYITATGGTDFQDYYDASEGGPAQSTYWNSTNSGTGNSDAKSYVPEMPWNNSCASSIFAALEGLTPVPFCNNSSAQTNGWVYGDVVGGSGGFSTNYDTPSYQSGITGYSGTMRAQPDISMFASNGWYGHYLVFCDSTLGTGYNCGSTSAVGGAGGTSFVAPQWAGLGGLLRDYTGTRQGVLNYALYALAKAQFTNAATKTACYSTGQTSNTGVTVGLPASSCIFNDITTGNNDVPCGSGSTDCYTGGGSYGVLSTGGSSSLAYAYNSGIGYDETTGIGSVNISNLFTKWNTAFTSTTALSASPTTITTAQSTTLTATVTGGIPAGYTGLKPTLAGSVKFYSGSTQVGTCTLSSGACTASVSGATLGAGTHSLTATFVGSSAYPTSTSTAVSVTVTSSSVNTTTAVTATPASATQGESVALKATVTATSGTATGVVTFTVSSTSLGTCTLSSGTCTLNTTALPVGSDTVTASYGGATGFSTSSGTVSITVSAATATTTTAVTATPNPAVIGQTVTVKATVTASKGTATGSVSFAVGSTSIGNCTLSSGSCSLSASTSTLTAGTYPVVATYAGTTGFGGSTSSTYNVVLNKAATTTTVTATPSTVTPPAAVKLTATVKRNAPGAGTATGTVTFKTGATTIGTSTLNGSGVATFSSPTTGVGAGSYPVTATYSGDTNDTTSSGNVTVTVN